MILKTYIFETFDTHSNWNHLTVHVILQFLQVFSYSFHLFPLLLQVYIKIGIYINQFEFIGTET
jgi:hypothetical protein